MKKPSKVAIIIGAGPAGLTAAYELVKRDSSIKPLVLEASDYLGGIAKTVNYKGNRMDMGGHRFFSKSDRVMGWWQDILPLEKRSEGETMRIKYQNKERELSSSGEAPDPEETDLVMLVRPRLSRIFFLGKFFDYPISLSPATVKNLGLLRMMKIAWGYLGARLFPRKPERSLEDFFINRFGMELYRTFFEDYTEKVWGLPPSKIPAEWGAQRVKGLSVTKAITHFIKKSLPHKHSLAQKETETSLIERFLYPKLGPGQMWQEVALRVVEGGGEIRMNTEVVGFKVDNRKVSEVVVRDTQTGAESSLRADYFFSSMPVRELISGFEPQVPSAVRRVADGLMYRDFITVGLLVNKLKLGEVKDNWMYIQEPGVKIGRLQIFNNWSPYLVKDPNTVWLGLEYFANEGDELWEMAEADFIGFAKEELARIGIIELEQVLDANVVKTKKAYPAYFGTYDEFKVVREFTDTISNLFLIGRNGMHKYNNQDHSMLTAIEAVDNVINGISSKENIWNVNTEQDYHESK